MFASPLKTLAVSLLCICGFVVTSSLAAEPAYQVATFQADITIPVGHACMGGGISDAKEIVDPLCAKGFVLLGPEKPIVFVVLDWCQVNNDSFDRWRDVLAEAAGTTPQRVMLSTVHQHDAPHLRPERPEDVRRPRHESGKLRPGVPRAGRPANGRGAA